jgi:hypothetical protein
MKNLLLLLAACLTAGVTAAPEIILGENAGALENFAAREVRRVWKASCGEELMIVRGGAVRPGAIVIGTPASHPAVADVQAALKLSPERPDEAAAHELGGVLYLAGIKPRSAVDAAMLFLREQIGARWLWWGEDGEFIPSHERIDFTGVARNHNPDIPLRRLAPKGNHMPEEFELYMSRNFGNVHYASEYDIPHKRVEYAKTRPDRGLPMTLGGHNTYLPSYLIKTRPELFALVNGQRNHTQLCLSHPENPKLVAARLAGVARAFGGFEEIRMSAPDNMSYCRCPECRKQPHTELYFKFIDGIAKNLKEMLPGVKVSTLAYQGYLLPPKNVRLESVDRVDYCPYDRCFSHRTSRTGCPANKQSLANIKAWRDTGMEVGVYGYLFDSISPVIALPMGGVVADEIRKYRELGVQFIDPEIFINSPGGVPAEQQNSVHFRLLCYIYLQLMYNPDLELSEVVRDWSHTAFGAAAGPFMTEYYLAQIEAFDQLKTHLTGLFTLPYQAAEELFSGGLGERCEKLLAQADRVIQEPRYRANLEREQRLYRTLKRAAQSTLKESFALLPVRNEGETEYTAALGQSGADIHYTPEAVKIRIQPGSEVLLATIADENSGKFRTFNADSKEATKRTDGRIELTLPFTTLQTAMPLPGETWRLGVRGPKGFYPEKLTAGDSFENFAYTVFSGRNERIRQMLVLLTPADVKRGTANAFRTAAHEFGFMVDFAFDGGEIGGDLSRYSGILLRTDGMTFTPETGAALKQAMEQGTVTVVSAVSENPGLDQWFNDPAYAFRRIDMLSSADARHAPGAEAILTKPQDLKWFGNRYPPLSSLVPEDREGWRPLLMALDGERRTVPFMNFKPVGKGLMAVSGCSMGFADGWRSFGELPNPQHTLKLFVNLLDYCENNQP